MYSYVLQQEGGAHRLFLQSVNSTVVVQVTQKCSPVMSASTNSVGYRWQGTTTTTTTTSSACYLSALTKRTIKMASCKMSPSQFLQFGLELMGYDLARQRRVRSAENLGWHIAEPPSQSKAERTMGHTPRVQSLSTECVQRPHSFSRSSVPAESAHTGCATCGKRGRKSEVIISNEDPEL